MTSKCMNCFGNLKLIVIQELLRSLPNCLLRCELYNEWVNTIQDDQKEAVPKIKQ